LNSKTIKNRANERNEKLKTGGKFKYITALMIYCLGKSGFAGHLFSCYSSV